jgi:hypothetical protein
MKPVFSPQDLKEAAQGSRARVAALRAEVERLEQWSQEMKQLESGEGELSGELDRLHGELSASFNEVPEAVKTRFEALLSRAQEADQAEVEDSVKKK